MGRAEVRVWPGLGHGQARAGNRTDREYDGVPRPRAEGQVVREGFGSPCDCLTFGGSCPAEAPGSPFPAPSRPRVRPHHQPHSGRHRKRPNAQPPAKRRGKRSSSGRADRYLPAEGGTGLGLGLRWMGLRAHWLGDPGKCERLPVPSPGSCPSGDHTVQGSGSGRAELAYFSQVVKYTSHVAISRWLPPQARPCHSFLPPSSWVPKCGAQQKCPGNAVSTVCCLRRPPLPYLSPAPRPAATAFHHLPP